MSRAKKVLLFLTFLLSAALAVAVGWGVATIRGVTGKGAVSFLDTIRNPQGKFPGRDRLNVLLIGKDYNYTDKGILYTKNARSDTLLVLSLDLNTRKISALSIPRDTYIERFPDTPRGGKINGAYARGGPRLAMQTVANLLGAPLDNYIALKPDAVRTIVDKLGGVEVEVLDRMRYDDSWAHLHIHLDPGRQTIDGEQAVGFTRFRKSNRGEPRSREEGDERRMARQQQLLRAIAEKAKQPQMILHARELINTALDAIETDLSRDQIVALAALFKDAKPEQMQTASLVGGNYSGSTGLSYFRADPDKTRSLVDWLLRGNETAAYGLTVVAVKNGTTVRGAAQHVAELLRDVGFDARSIRGAGSAAAEVPQTRILYGKAAVAPRAERIAALLQINGQALSKQPVESLEGADVAIVLGRDVAPHFAAQTALAGH
jgi:LCP family protein required for cell wall assembly